MTAIQKLNQYFMNKKQIVFDNNHIYTILECLGQGGQAVVYKCNSSEDNEEVTVRIFFKKTHQDQWEKQKLQIEQQEKNYPFVQRALRYYEHVVVQKPSTGITGKTVIIQVLQYAPKRLEQEYSQLSMIERKLVIQQVATALHHFHKESIIHRDVKPDNVFLTNNNMAQLSDLGIARRCDCHVMTQIGTPAWCAPEVWITCMQGDDEMAQYGYEADAWSLGCVIYYLAVGTILFDNQTPDNIQEKLSTMDFNEVEDLDMRKWCKKLIIFDKDVRRQNWDLLREELALSE